MQDATKTLGERVIDLHDIARQLEQELGRGNLSDDIRQCANRLSYYIKERVEDVVR